jgi:tetratricopeptide (TPR) repeat protein
MNARPLLLGMLIAGAAHGQTAAVLARADAAWTANRHDEAYAAYDSVVRADSNAASRAVYRLGVLKSWRNDLQASIRLHQLYVRQEPRDLEGRVGLARVYSWASKFPESIATYDTVLAREADYRDAAFGRATALAWWGKLDESIAAYDAWIKTHPTDNEAKLNRARVLSWAGRLDEALAVYETAAKSGEAAEAEKGVARVTGWKGDLDKSEGLWRAATEHYPKDPETWVGLGQVQRWMGRPFAARDALNKALEVRPSYDDARAQMRWVRAEIGQSFRATYTGTTDSEENGGGTVGVAADAAVGTNARAGVRVQSRNNTATASSGTSSAVRVVGDWQPGDGKLGVHGEVGSASVSSLFGGNVSHNFTTPLFGVRGRAQVSERIRVGAGYSRDAFDDIVRTMYEGMATSTFDADASLSLPSRVTISAGMAATQARGDTMSSNSRTSFTASARWMPNRELALMANMRTFGWDHPAYGTYFAPQRFTLTEVAARYERAVDLGWQGGVEVGLGTQSIRFESDPASSRGVSRGSIFVGWRFEPGREVLLTWLFANVASAGTLKESEYSYRALTLTARITR